MSATLKYNEEEIWNLLSEIPDPEIPVITIVELGVLRKVEIENNMVVVTITPTYSGCPAMKAFEDDIVSKLKENDIKDVQLKTVFSPAWTTEWMTEEAKRKLKEYGIAPPVSGSQDKGFLFESGPKEVECPKCNSKQTELVSQFSSTACKAMYKCTDCLEPFEYFKCI